MARRILIDIVLFLLPFALYAVYWRLARKGDPEREARPHPWALLFVSGLVLVAASFLWLGLSETGREKDGVYVPPHAEDGRIVPGHVEKKPPK
jgi:heme/copper-type cytochrome/quinol oxidase subunit 3